MTIEHIASVSVGGVVPALSGVVAAAQAKLAGELAARMRVAGLIEITPPRLNVAANALLAASLQASLPGVKINATAQLSAIAALEAQLKLLLKLLTAMGAAGVEVYEYNGTAALFGAEVANETSKGLPGGSPNDHMNALVIATRIPECWYALSQVLLT